MAHKASEYLLINLSVVYLYYTSITTVIVGGSTVSGKLDHDEAKVGVSSVDKSTDQLAACIQCDAIWQVPPLEEKERVRCGRCGAVIAQRKASSLDDALAGALSMLILLIISLSFPFLTVEQSGLSNRISVFDAIWALWLAGMPIVMSASFLLIIVAPVLQATLLVIVLRRARSSRASTGPSQIMYRFARLLQPWAMAEIFLIGVIVSLVKVGDLANLSVGPAFWAMCGLVASLALAQSGQCNFTIWRRLRP